MASTLWHDPLADVEQLVRTVFGTEPERPAGWTPASEVYRDGDDAVVQVELPGIDPGADASVEIERGHLVVRGERKRPADAPASSVRERRYGPFRRIFRLPDHVGPESLSATYEAGVLTVRVAGAYSPPEPVRIQVSAGAPRIDAASASAPTVAG